jgi:DNA-binding NtrC family response regulator
VDVRVVAATHRNLVELIQRGEFREDLYHRLKVLYLKLPPLRERKGDVRLLIQHFLGAKGGVEIQINEKVYQRLEEYNWYGNVRELENTIDYMLAVAEKQQIELDDLPAESFFQHPGSMYRSEATPMWESALTREGSGTIGEEALILLQMIHELALAGEVAGRQRLVEICAERGMILTENQIRHRLNELESQGLIVKHRGRFGTKLTPKGSQTIRSQG